MINNIYGTHDINTIEQFCEIQKRAKRSALMADGHLGYVMPVGVVMCGDEK
jgi:tRNA-splicing ligase RtcB